ncbi:MULTISPECIES: BTAD domain-containing putative transcriptional regulator [unclassified Ensifer]|uniref:BTAD domain-containing putative transcriptional regulator n=1 Tax=unclassified Ensifer TaxID=2633371 RepID=UPI0009F5500E|nr:MULTISPECIES: BTAD domain-containing putative transcriptional regulator [unclassified Ensifer]
MTAGNKGFPMRVRLFGGFDLVSPQGQAVRFSTRKATLVFAALVLAGKKGRTREALAEAFWPDRGGTQARNSLRQALVDIRRVFPSGNRSAILITSDNDNLVLTASNDDVDVWLFDQKTSANDTAALAFAADLYVGDLLGAEPASDGVEWFAPYRMGYRRAALELVERLSLAAPRGGLLEELACERLAERLLKTDPSAEEAHRALIRIYLNRGKANAALRQYLLCQEVLRRDLGVEPEQATRALLSRQIDGTPDQNLAAAYSPAPAVPTQASISVPRRRRDQPSIVVMPFDNLSGEDDGYFVDGVVEEITAALSRVRDFFVIARQSAFVYKGRFIDVREVGEELGVAYVVEGTVRRGGSRLRISVQLVDARSRNQLWSDRYEGDTSELFAFQDRIAAQVAGALHPAVRLAEIEAARSTLPADLDAYDLVMRAFPKLWGQNSESMKEAVAILRQAIVLDPNYGRAHALLAWCLALSAQYLWTDDIAGTIAAALDEVEKATGLIDNDPTALTACGSAASLAGDTEKGLTFIKAALSLDPNNAWAWNRFGWAGIYQNEPEDARARFERAMALSPLDPFAFNMSMGVGATLSLEGRWKEAAEIAKDVVTRHPNVTWAYRMLASWSALADDLATARWAARRFLELQPDFTIARHAALPVSRRLPHLQDVIAGLIRAGVPEK